MGETGSSLCQVYSGGLTVWFGLARRTPHNSFPLYWKIDTNIFQEPMMFLFIQIIMKLGGTLPIPIKRNDTYKAIPNNGVEFVNFMDDLYKNLT